MRKMEETTIEIFDNYEDFAKKVSHVKLNDYLQYLRSGRENNENGSMGAYYCAVSKKRVSNFEEAIPILFLAALFDWEEWEENYDPVTEIGEETWLKQLVDDYVPVWFDPLTYVDEEHYGIRYQFIDKMTHWATADGLWGEALPSGSKAIIRCGDLEDINYYYYYVETEYVIFNSWLTD